jgi:hypothetical protein
MKKNKGNEPNGVIIHIYMETQAKTIMFFFLSFLFLLQNQRTGLWNTGPAQLGWEDWYQWERKGVRERG